MKTERQSRMVFGAQGWTLCGAGLLVLLFCLAAVRAPDASLPTMDYSEIHSRFATGNKHYQNGEYKKAEAEYRALIEAGVRDPVLFYNAGNAYVQLGQKGRAIVMYERALRLNPRDEQARENLDLIRPSAAPAPFILWRPFLFVRDLFSLNKWLWVLDGLILFTAVSLAVLFLLRNGAVRAIARYAFAAGLVLTLVAACFTPWRWYVQRGRDVGVVVESKVVSRHGPTEGHGEHLSLAEGARVEILGHEGNGWLRIRPLDVPRADRETTYVKSQAVEEI